MTHDEAAVVFALFSQPTPKGLVRWWIDDGQGGGWIDYVTPEEYERREAALARGADPWW